MGGAIYNKNGIDPYKVAEHLAVKGSVAGYSEAESYNPDDFFTINCDILGPAALENVITEKMPPV